jgi:hypothetical protein
VKDWTEEDWRAFWEERAAIREYDGGYTRKTAELLATADVIIAKREIGLTMPENHGR